MNKKYIFAQNDQNAQFLLSTQKLFDFFFD